MRFALTILGGQLLDLEIVTDGGKSDAPPFGFQGSGAGVVETVETERDTDL